MTAVLLVLTVAAGAAGGAVWLRRRWLIVAVVGRSMEPTLRSGDRVLVRRVPPSRLDVGQLVVFDGAHGEPGRGYARMVKRLAALPGDPVPEDVSAFAAAPAVVPAGQFAVLGDNPAMSVDSRRLGLLPLRKVIGVVVRVLS